MIKLNQLIKYLTIPLLLTGVASINSVQPSQAQQSRGKASFLCEKHNGSPATIAKHPKRGNITLIVWNTLYFGDNFPPELRCSLVSERFQQTNTNGSLNYIVSGTRNDYPVLCASTTKPTDLVVYCPEERLLMTLKKFDDSQAMIQNIAELNAGRSVDPVLHSAEILQESPNGSLVGIDVGVLLRLSHETETLVESTKADPFFPDNPNSNNDCLFGLCE